jgi:hypothetical protein
MAMEAAQDTEGTESGNEGQGWQQATAAAAQDLTRRMILMAWPATA